MFKSRILILTICAYFYWYQTKVFSMMRYAILYRCMNYEEFKEYDNHQY